ncbi:MAG: hypothetical protein HOY69_06470 [Streptomyces sp.]|nr:hypothetical protein [Streptomyces sp.]
MINKRIAAGLALTAGLGLAGVAAAPVSGAATPSAAHATHAQAAKSTAGHKAPGKGKGKGGKQIVCIIQIGGPGKPGGPVTFPPLPGKPAKGTAGKTIVKIVNGKVYINGKPAAKGSVHIGTGADCPPPPPAGSLPGQGGGVIVHPGDGGKGGVILHPGEGGVVTSGSSGASGEAGVSTSGLRA